MACRAYANVSSQPVLLVSTQPDEPLSVSCKCFSKNSRANTEPLYARLLCSGKVRDGGFTSCITRLSPYSQFWLLVRHRRVGAICDSRGRYRTRPCARLSGSGSVINLLVCSIV